MGCLHEGDELKKNGRLKRRHRILWMRRIAHDVRLVVGSLRRGDFGLAGVGSAKEHQTRPRVTGRTFQSTSMDTEPVQVGRLPGSQSKRPSTTLVNRITNICENAPSALTLGCLSPKFDAGVVTHMRLPSAPDNSSAPYIAEPHLPGGFGPSSLQSVRKQFEQVE
jgi:hypothetical protein